MSAQTLQLPAPPPAPAGAQWIDLDEAIRRMGRNNPGHLRRMCHKVWHGQGLARLTKPDKGKPRWEVREDAHPDLARVKTSEQIGDDFDCRQLTDEQRSILSLKITVVTEWLSHLLATPRGQVGPVKAQFLEELSRRGTVVSERTLDNWVERWHTSKRAGLVDDRWTVKRDNSPTPYARFFALLEDWYLNQNEPKIKTCFKLACAQARKEGAAVHSYKAACRHIAKLSKRKTVLGRKGPTAFANTVASYIARDYTRIVVDGVEREFRSNDIWCADHHPCDTLVSYKGKIVRPWLSAWQDLRSRKIVGYVYSPHEPDSSTVLSSMRHGVINTGLSLPLFAYTDNGKDYDCYFLQGQTKWERRQVRVEREQSEFSIGPSTELVWKRRRVRIDHDQEHFKGIYGLFQIRVMHAIPYNAKAKPIERFFGTYEDQFGKLQRTYCGKDPQSKPEHLADRLKKGDVPTFEEYVADATAWIEQVYHEDIHTGHGMDAAPNAVYAENLTHKRTTTEEMLFHFLVKHSRPVKVGRNGISYEGRLYGQGNRALMDQIGNTVHLRTNPDDITRVEIVDLGGRFICHAAANKLMPFGAVKEQAWKDAHREVRSYNKALKQVRKRGMGVNVDAMDVLLEHQQQEQERNPGQRPTPPTPSMQMVQTGLEGDLKNIRDSLERADLAIAVGAESMSHRSIADMADEDFEEVRNEHPAMRLAMDDDES